MEDRDPVTKISFLLNNINNNNNTNNNNNGNTDIKSNISSASTSPDLTARIESTTPDTTIRTNISTSLPTNSTTTTSTTTSTTTTTTTNNNNTDSNAMEQLEPSSIPLPKPANGKKNSKNADSATSSSSYHSASRYLYTQPKSRSSIPFDPIQLEIRQLINQNHDSPVRIFHEQSKLSYHLNDNISIPEFIVNNSDDIPNPIKFYESVKDLGAKYGAVKLKILNMNKLNTTITNINNLNTHNHDTTVNDMMDSINLELNFEQFWFKTRRQYSHNFNDLELEFYSKLFKFHKQKYMESASSTINNNNKNYNNGSLKIPSIDKRVLDLYHFWNCVQLRGGFDAVCQRKFWAQIGRELGYSGKIMSSLSTSLRAAYVKVLLDFEKDQVEVKMEIQSSQSSQANVDSKDEHVDKKQKLNTSETEDGFYKVNVSRRNYTRIRDIKTLKNLPIHFDSVTEEKPIITKSNNKLLPTYDFKFWNSGMETYDKNPFELKTSSIYNIKQYYEKSQIILEKIKAKYAMDFPEVLSAQSKVLQQDFEKLYFHFLSSNNPDIEIETGLELDFTIHKNPLTATSLNKLDPNKLINPWRLENIPLSEDSLLNHIDIDMGNYTRSNYEVGMFFSIAGWSTNDLFLPSIDYNHLGSSKLWYIIPHHSMEKFQSLINNLAQNDTKKKEAERTMKGQLDDDFMQSEFYKSYLETTNANTSPEDLEKNFPTTKIAKLANLTGKYPTINYQFTPDFLRANDIEVHTISQEYDSYVFIFPGTYHSTVGAGVYLSQNATFAPKSWLNYIKDGEEYISRNKLLTSINMQSFLTNILLNSENKYEDRELLYICQNNLLPLVNKEIEYRTIIENLNDRFRIPIVFNRFDFISNFSLASTGFSKVVISSGNELITLSIEEFLAMYTLTEESFNVAGYEIEDISVHYSYSNEFLEALIAGENITTLKKLSAILLDPHEVTTQLTYLVENVCKNGRVPLDLFRSLVSQMNKKDERLSTFQNIIQSTTDLQTACRNLILNYVNNISQCPKSIVYSKGFNITILTLPTENDAIEQLFEMKKKFDKSSIEFKEMTTIITVCHEIDMFKEYVEKGLTRPNLEELRLIYEKSFEIPIPGRLLQEVVGHLYRLEWLKLYKILVDKKQHDELSKMNLTLSSLQSFLRFGVEHCTSHDISELQFVKSRIMEIENINERIVKLVKGRRTDSKIPIDDVYDIARRIRERTLPIVESSFKIIEDLYDNLENVKIKFNPFWERLNINKEFIDPTASAIRKNSLEYLPLLERFDGSVHDKRLDILKVENQGLLNKQFKESKYWLNQLYKKVKRVEFDKFTKKAKECLNLDDDPYIPSENCANNQTRYCFCRGGDIGTMVQCEICQEWYHTACINNGNWTLPEDNDTVFLCSLCNNGNKTIFSPVGTFEYADMKRLVLESLKLEMLPNRRAVQSLFDIFKDALNFRNEFQESLFKGGHIDMNVPIHKIKHYLRKAKGSRCGFLDLVGPLQRYCYTQEAEKLEQLRNSSKMIITGYDSNTRPTTSSPTLTVTPSTIIPIATISSDSNIGIENIDTAISLPPPDEADRKES
ncbi:Ecm5p NDAI_0I00930 [Naumovozyma dairenensis CBS 421]|uniref:Uncharacterized protein n=1 Tax=Naumovozyma dairenensis (strain ATCC 10597 / BCRC 20456 / CBS 421 / NBRC 0211 / NRRL Y-12639) TaxID=1071378 RepID=G0WFV1_NAUDC|nr:hypothetical protein NDAI_0I00930 [Naumovozyma dairenensis CBS 421]CCD26662.1 hypothetical protein NDAI_0I00930 [Naumovozyma dairenensis CBS 421]